MHKTVIQNSRKFRSVFYPCGVSLCFIISFLILFSSQLMAQGNLLIFPHRVVFEGQNRVMEMNIANTGKDSAKFSLSFLQYRLTDDGGYEKITTPDPGQNFADNNIRFYPRSIILGPNTSQVVKLQLTKSEQLEPGEYRSHLYFRALKNPKALGDMVAKVDSASISIKITPIFGITIPIIIRVGKSTTTLNITDLKLLTATDGTSKMQLSIHRAGNMSSFGDISVLHIAPNGKETKIGTVKGVTVYTPNLLRKLTVDLENVSSVDMSKGTIHVLYTSQSEKRPEKFAETELAL